MTVSSNARKAGPFTGDGVATEFPFAFTALSTSDIAVYLRSNGSESLLVEGSDYVITLNLDQDATPGGTITTVTPGPGGSLPATPLPTGDQLYVIGCRTTQQDAAIKTAGALPLRTAEATFDSVVVILQQLEERIGRALVKSVTDPTDLAALFALLKQVQEAPVQSVNGQTGDVTLVAADVAAVSYNSQSLSDAQKIQAQRNLGTQLFFGQDFPTGTVAPAALMKFDADGMWIDFVVRQVTPIWHGYVSSLMLMADTADKVVANTWADPYGYIHDGALRPDGTPQQGITCTPGNFASFDLSSGDFTIEFFFAPSAYDNTYSYHCGILSLGNDYVGSLRYFLRYIGGAGFQFYVYPSPGSPQLAAYSASVLTTGAEHHIAVQRISGVYSITVNGADVTYEQHNVSPMAPVSENLFSLGQIYCGGYSEQMTGAIRQFRMTKGIAVYPTYPFTPPTSFPSSI